MRAATTTVHVEIWRGQNLLDKSSIALGPSKKPPKDNPFTLTRNLLWLLQLLAIQLLLVAFPEELFYRGYLLNRMEKIFPQQFSIFGIPLTIGNIITSALFALTHLLIGFNPQRLGVFFPSLIFGIIKSRSGTLLGAVVFHASANILIKILETLYI